MRRAAPRSESQTLITGVYRTGTEFVAQLLTGHPDLSTTMYHVNAARFVRGCYARLDDPTNLAQAVEDIGQRLTERYGIDLDRQAVLDSCAACNTEGWTGLYDALMSALWLDADRRHWAEKCQLVWRAIPEFIAGMPNGRAIIVIRDPRSVLASFKRYTYAAPPAYLGAVFNCLDAMTTARNAVSESGERLRILRYEDAALDPRGTARGLYEFLGLDPDQAVFEPANWRDSSGAAWRKNTVFEDDNTDFNVDKSIHRWKGTLADWEIAFTESVCGAVMTTFGYQTSGLTTDWPAALRTILPNEEITGHLRHWLATGEGIEAFPTDPLDRGNWEENALASNG